MAVADRHDFAAFTAASRTDGSAPFFAEPKVASMKASLRSILPRSRRSSASVAGRIDSGPLPLLKAAMTRLIRRIASRQVVPRRAGAEHPQHAVEDGARVRPWAPASIGASPRTKRRFEHRPLGVGEVHALDLRRSVISFNRLSRVESVYETTSSSKRFG